MMGNDSALSDIASSSPIMMVSHEALSEKLLGGQASDARDATTASEQEHVIMDEALHQQLQQRQQHQQLQQSHGVPQPPRYRDAWAAVLFVLHWLVILYLAFAWGLYPVPESQQHQQLGNNDTDLDNEIHLSGLFTICFLCSLAAFVLVGGALSFMTRYALQLIQISLLWSASCSFLLALVFAAAQLWWAMSLSLLMVALGAYYAWAIWHRIPFAAANLQTATTAIKRNAGTVVVAFVMTIIMNILGAFQLLAWLGVYKRHAVCDADGACHSQVSGIVIVLFLLSFYWTAQVGKNIVNVTVAGVVGTFWFAPDDAAHFFSSGVWDSWLRATTCSLGSICLGSLVTATFHLLYQLAHQAQRQQRQYGHASILLCIIECILGFLERLIQYFNKWAYVYIGLYGYDYLTAGKMVIDLFHQRGWSSIISDQLIQRTLDLVCLVLGVMTGAIGYLLALIHPSWVESFGSTTGTALAFLVPFFMGTLMATAICMGVVASAADTVVVAFAEAPADLQRNHPGLYQQMVMAWRSVYPNEFQL